MVSLISYHPFISNKLSESKKIFSKVEFEQLPQWKATKVSERSIIASGVG